MESLGKTPIKGQITAIHNSEKLISKTYIYSYMVLSVQTESNFYSVFINSSKINTYDFLPRVGQFIQAEGIQTPSRDGVHDYSISHLSELVHIETPKKQKI